MTEPVKHNVDMDAYDAEMLAAGFEFTDDEPEDPYADETDLTFLVATDTPPDA